MSPPDQTLTFTARITDDLSGITEIQQSWLCSGRFEKPVLFDNLSALGLMQTIE